MLQERLENLSLIYWLRDKFSSYSFVTVLDGFPEPIYENGQVTNKLSIPSIAVEWDWIEGYYNELGNRVMANERFYYVDIYAASTDQRDEFAYKIYHDFDEGIPVYNYNLGFPPTVVPQIGVLVPVRKRIQVIRIMPELTDKLYYRAVAQLTATYTSTEEI